MGARRAGYALLTLLWGCAGGVDDPDSFPPPACTLRGFDVPQDLFTARCGTSDCHAPPAVAGALDLASPGVVSRLLDVASSRCAPRRLVDTSSPSASYLLDKVSAVPRCGDSMPLGQDPLSADERSCLEGWVRSVAAGMADSP